MIHTLSLIMNLIKTGFTNGNNLYKKKIKYEVFRNSTSVVISSSKRFSENPTNGQEVIYLWGKISDSI